MDVRMFWVYETDPLSEDETVVGPVGVSLDVSTSGTDSDFVVKLIDVYPNEGLMNGYEMLVRGEPFRAKYRKSFSTPEPMKPSQPTEIHYEMPDINHSFLKGHRIMVQIQSSWFPLMDRNPQKFVNIYQATEEDFETATERVYHSAQLPSHLTIARLP
jgi:putative CocE/NonD family hydrolase